MDLYYHLLSNGAARPAEETLICTIVCFPMELGSRLRRGGSVPSFALQWSRAAGEQVPPEHLLALAEHLVARSSGEQVPPRALGRQKLWRPSASPSTWSPELRATKCLPEHLVASLATKCPAEHLFARSAGDQLPPRALDRQNFWRSSVRGRLGTVLGRSWGRLGAHGAVLVASWADT